MRRSTNSFSKKRFTKGSGKWRGDNIDGSQFGFDQVDAGGGIFGNEEFGGLSHFRSRPSVRVNHK